MSATSPRLAGPAATHAAAGATTGGPGSGTAGMGAAGPDHAFLRMLAPLAVAGVLLVSTARTARDVASALSAERRTR